MIDAGRAIQHPFEDKDWVSKIAIGSVIALVPVFNFTLNGYMLAVMRNTSRGHDVPLPLWENLTGYLIDGLKMFVVQLMYAIPILALGLGLMVLTFVAGLLTNHFDSASDAITTVYGLLVTGTGCIVFVYLLAFSFLLPALYIGLARTDEIASALRIHDIVATMRKDFGSYVLVAVTPVLFIILFTFLYMLLGLIPFVNICLSCITYPALFLMVPYFSIVLGHLYGQMMRS
ncbi:MAG TPA: DUF4013 domain-containing protein [Anaerolineae bacterium]